MVLNKKIKYSLLASIFIFTVIVWSRFNRPDHNILSWDNFGYYLYLPNYFIYKDPGMENINRIDSLRIHYQSSSTLYQVYKGPKGKYIIRYSMGNAVFYSPFFFAGHLLAGILKFEQDGFSKPYQWAIMYGSLLYALIALIYSRKILLKYLNDVSVAITLVALFLGTNLYHMLAYNNGLTHGNLFMVYVLILWNTIKWHEFPKWKYALGIGFFCGLAIITRPTEIISVLIPMMWGVFSKEKWNKIWQNKLQILIIPVIMFLIGLPQMLYWKTYAGEYIFRSYDNPGEGLDLWSPHTLPFLFSFRKGWLLYSPIMLASLIGVLMLWKKRKDAFYASATFIFLFIWITSSWTNWWYAGSFGSRAMVQSYGIMLLPLGVFIDSGLKTKNGIIKYGIISFLIGGIFLNQFQTWQYNRGIIHAELMTKAYYWKVFLKTSVTEKDKDLLLPEVRIDGPMVNSSKYNLKRKIIFDFEDKNQIESHKTNHLSDTIFKNGEYSYCIDSTDVFFNLISIPYDEITSKNHGYIRVKGWVLNKESFNKNRLTLVRTMNFKEKPYYYSGKDLTNEEHGVNENEWSYFQQDYMTPHVRSKKDTFHAYFWLRGTKPVYLDDIVVEIWEPIN